MDASRFGVNAFRSRMTQSGGVLTLSQRGWLYGLFFGLVAAGLTVAIVVKRVAFSGSGILLYAGALLCFVVGLLYTLYVQEVSFDAGRRRWTLRKGFLGFARETEAGFDAIGAVVVKRVRMTSTTENAATETYEMWDIGVESASNPLPFDLWRACDRETATHVAQAFADAFGCPVRELG